MPYNLTHNWGLKHRQYQSNMQVNQDVEENFSCCCISFPRPLLPLPRARLYYKGIFVAGSLLFDFSKTQKGVQQPTIQPPAMGSLQFSSLYHQINDFAKNHWEARSNPHRQHSQPPRWGQSPRSSCQQSNPHSDNKRSFSSFREGHIHI